MGHNQIPHYEIWREKKESIFKAILAENFPVYRENNGHPDLWGQKDPYQLKHNRAIPKCIIINVSKVVHKGRILKAAGKKVPSKGTHIRLLVDIASEIFQVRRE